MITGFGTTRDAVTAMRLGALDFLEKPVFEEGLLDVVRSALNGSAKHHSAVQSAHAGTDTPSAHAAARWARALMPIVDSPTDPRTLGDWSRLAYASPGALRNWCRMAGISPRRSLVFARLLRAVVLNRDGRHSPENLLDVADRRTLDGLLRLGGLNRQHDFPHDIHSFLQRQTLVRDPDTMLEVQRAIEAAGCR